LKGIIRKIHEFKATDRPPCIKTPTKKYQPFRKKQLNFQGGNTEFS
jgi:hypothetical protein